MGLKRIHIKSFILGVLCWGLILLAAGRTQAEGGRLETKYTVLMFGSTEVLARYYEAVDYGPGNLNRSPSLLSEAALKKNTATKTDAVFERAQAILDMKKRIPKIRIRLYPDKAALKRVYSMLSRDKRVMRAWYLFRSNTVYLNVRDLHEGILAHELAHGIIDNFLRVRPPANTAEILARYVDAHLK